MFRLMLTYLVYIVTFGCCALVGDAAWAQVHSPSLWERRDPRLSNLVADVKARRTGDVLFVTINEQSDIENIDRRLMRKQTSASSEISGSYALGNGSAGSLTAEEATAADRNFNGDTQYRSEREFMDRFSVQVVDVQPNGNLLIGGTRDVLLEGDNRKLVLSGVVRSVDIRQDNSVSSRLVSNLQIRYVSDAGAENKFINQGWLGKKFNWIWPF